MKKKLALLLCLTLTTSFCTGVFATEVTEGESKKIVLIHTNDVHCNIENDITYSGIAAYKTEMEEVYGEEYVTLIDAGDAIQGGPLGTLTQGQAIIEIMNEVGYDIFAPGNHEFDYGAARFLELAEMTEAHIIASNFLYIDSMEPVFDPYTIVSYGDVEIAYVGTVTPDTFTTSTPVYFQDENGNFLYSFCEDETGVALYENIQASVDEVIELGADYVILVAHIGEGDAENIIAATTGIDIMLDGHSHSVVENKIVQNKDGEDVVLNQAGDKLNYIGKVIIDPELDTITAELIDDYDGRDESVDALISEINAEFEVMLTEVIGMTEVDLMSNREGDSNLGNLLADSYKIMLNTEIGLVNAGGIRANIEKGDITYGDLVNVQPFSNDVSSVIVDGQTILDALEHGAKNSPDSSGGFLYTSGVTYEIHNYIPATVTTDDKGSFTGVTGEYRVQNVMVNGEPLELDRRYSVASHNYLLHNGGDGMVMFEDAEIIVDMFMVDNEMFIKFLDEKLGGIVAEPYMNVEGDGRILVVTEPVEVAEEVTEETAVVEETVEEATEEVTEEIAEEVEEATEEVAEETVEEVEEETTVVEEMTAEVEEVVEMTTLTPATEIAQEVASDVNAGKVVNGVYTVVNNDSLWKIAQQQLGQGARFSEIYELNKDIIKGSEFVIHPGQELKMPA